MSTVLSKIFGDIDNFFQKMFTKIKMIPHAVYVACNELYPEFVKIKADLESGKAIALFSLVPGAEVVREDLLICINAGLTALGFIEGTIEQKYNTFITENATHTPAVKMALLIKALSVSTAQLHGNTEHESVYDTAAQNTVYTHLAA